MAESEQQTTIIGADSHFKGELTFERVAKIIGRFDGKISGKGELQIAQNAKCQADLDLATANIDGEIEGNVTAKDTVRLNANGRVKGDITAGKMVMAEGASFYGMCAVGPEASRNAGGSSGSKDDGNQGGQPQAAPQQPKK